jgi:protein-disulfide isomerase
MSQLKIPVGPEDHSQGDAAAPCTLVEYGDYQCPYCGQAYPMVKRLQKHFGRRLRFVFRNFPLNQAHPYAEVAAETAEFAAAHGKFWEMHDLLYENQDRLDTALLPELTEALQLSVQELQTALQTGKYRGRVRADFSGGVRSGVNGTPSFYINGQRHDEAPAYEELIDAIGRALIAAGVKS